MINIPAAVRDQVLEHVLQGFPNEACGLLAGHILDGTGDAAAQTFYPMTNADASPVTYRLDPKEQLQAFDLIEGSGLDLVGIVHSHTHSEAYPSETDRKQAFYPDAHHLLVSLSDRNNPVLRAFTIHDGLVEEQDVTIT